MARIEQSIEVNAPAPTVYNQLTQFESYPRFMEDIEEVRQLDDTHLHWRAKMNSHDIEWDAEIMEQVPDKLIAWRNMGGPIKMERVEVQPLDQNRSKLTMTLEYEAPQQQTQGQEGDLEIKIAEHGVHDLMCLKRFIESRGRETGAWRGEVRGGKEVKPPSEGQQPQQGQPQQGQPQQGQQQAGQQGPRPNSATAEAQQTMEQQPSSQQASTQAQGAQQPSQQAGQAQQEYRQPVSVQQGGGQVGAPQQQAMQGAEHDPMLSAMTSMNPQSWLPNVLHAWEEPFVMMRKMTEDMDDIFERFLGRPMYGAKLKQAAMPSGATAWSPPMEVTQRDSQLVIRAELPGVKQEDVHVEIKNDRLVIEGDRPEESQREAFRRTERSYGHFYRAIALPEGVNPEQATASMHDGILEVTVPVQQMRQQGRHLDIRSSR
jgi:HSP20 family molecular chaperone IbpA/ribosome-associated toxin RatA of RatAB toxin-antitoxin module